ncbi:hypothetical protein [Bacteroides congonensis]
MEAIGLNPIRLDAIGIDPIRLNAIRLGVPGASSGSNRPYIDPEVLASLVAVCICDGKSNNDPDRAIIKNLVDPANPFVISNAAYTKGSGYADKDSPYYGALVTDGVNDMITSTKTMSEMLGGGNKCTVISFITHISGAGKYNIIGDGGIQVSDYSGQSFMAGCSSKSGEKIVELGDKEKIQAFQYTTFDSKLSIGSLETGLEISSYAYYGTFVFNKDSVPIDWIHQVIAYFYLDKYVTADIIYDTIRQGITNENHASFNDELVDFSGNGHNLKIYNSAWNKESGINDEGAWQTDGVSDYGQYVGNLGLKDYTVAVDRAYVEAKASQVPIMSNVVDNSVSTPFLMEHLGVEKILAPHSFGKYTALSELNINRFISYQSTYKYNGIDITKGTSTNTGSGLTIGRIGGIANQYAKICLRSLMLFPYSLSEFLLERQLKRYKLGTLHPDMVEVRPIINSTGKYFRIEYRNGQGGLIQPGSYLPVSSILRISVVLNNNWDEVSSLKVDGVDIPKSSYSNNNFWIYDATVTKSPQKIDITIDEYIRYEDIVQPYPCILNIPKKEGNGYYTYGDKIPVGYKFIRSSVNQLLPELYQILRIYLNGEFCDIGSEVTVSKEMVFSCDTRYLKDNEPNCILSPQTLRIPNASYKILGYIPDLTGKGNHGKINNSAYAGMSGANGYSEDFTSWLHQTEGTLTDSKFKATGVASTRWVLYKGANYNFPTNTYIATGIPNNVTLTYNNGTNVVIIENRVPFTISAYSASSATGFVLSKGVGLDLTGLIIQQIGEYEGSFRLDGVEDFITIPTLASGAKQVLMKVNTQNMNGVLYDQRKSSGSPWYFAVYNTTEADSVAYAARNTNGKTYIDGVLNANITCQQLLNITHNLTVTNNGANEQNTQSPVIGASRSAAANFSKMALFTFMSFDEISSEDEIKELNDIVGIEGGYVESPNYYFDAYGKSNNLDEDIDYQGSGTANTKGDIYDKSITGLQVLEDYSNGGSIVPVRNRQLTLNNFAFNEESGYGGWLGIGNLTTALNYGSNTTTNNWKRGGTFLKGRDRNNKTGCGYALANWFDNTNPILKFKIKITGLTDADELYICQYNIIDPEIKQQLFNGINEVTLDLSASIEPTYRYISFRYPPLTNDVDFEFLYEYQNGLVSDGVEDYLSNTAIPAFTDFTVIAKRTILDTPVNSAFCCKGEDYYTRAAFMLEFRGGSNEQVASFGTLASGVNLPDLITFMTATSYNGRVIGKGTIEDTVGLWVGRYNAATFWKGVFYKMMLYSKTIDQLSINMLKNLFAKDELIDVNNPIFKK